MNKEIKHMTMRLAWHNHGWNGKNCSNPNANPYCVGLNSYPGQRIKEVRTENWEKNPTIKGLKCANAEGILPCSYSSNAFGIDELKTSFNAPAFYKNNSEIVYKTLPPATATIWPYEGMYSDDALNSSEKKGKYDYDQRIKNAKGFFKELSPDRSLIFYYANYSNPFSNDQSKKYVLVGVSRLKKVGDLMFFDNADERDKDRYAGAFIWQMPITSNYPNEGFHIPYEHYLEDSDVIDKILLVPEQMILFKHAAKHTSSDQALSLVEKLIEIVNYLMSIDDHTYNWEIQLEWLQSLLVELWQNRGLYPGLLGILNYLNFGSAISYFKLKTELGNEKKAKNNIFSFLKGEDSSIADFVINENETKKVRRNWNTITQVQRDLFENIYCKIGFDQNSKIGQISNLLSMSRTEFQIYSKDEEIYKNPYILSEEYLGKDYSDTITFNMIDHAMLPSPDLGGKMIFEKNDPERLRALIIEALKTETVHSFSDIIHILEYLNRKISYLPDWKNQFFTEAFIKNDIDFLKEKLVFKKDKNKQFIYLKDIYDNERLIANVIKELASRPSLQFKMPINEDYFYDLLFDESSVISLENNDEYNRIIKDQARVCTQIFNKPISVISGAAGTGKTTILDKIIKAIEKAHGIGHSFLLLSPTGKAADRIREKTNKDAITIHSFLATNNWLNPNLSFKKGNDSINSNYQTIIIDETSMVDLTLFATLIRSINWNSVARLILVGDPNQLPPIGKGKVFQEIITYLSSKHIENYGKLKFNIRQLENKVKNAGTGILELAGLYIQENNCSDNFDKSNFEKVIKKIQLGGKIYPDLSVEFWHDENDLNDLMKLYLEKDLKEFTKMDSSNIEELWYDSRKKSEFKASFLQFLSPLRSNFFGVDNLNQFLQDLLNSYNATKKSYEGIAYFDKVIQYRNRTRSNPLTKYDANDYKVKDAIVYNGEIGYVRPNALDSKKWRWEKFRPQRFQVVFDRKPGQWVSYGRKCAKKEGHWINEKPEENLELAYAISIHKAQGSEFDHVYLILPKGQDFLISMELIYTAITRAQKNLTIFAQDDISTFLRLSRKEASAIGKINSSIFNFDPLPDEVILRKKDWFEEGKKFDTLSGYYVRSKSEVIIANLLHHYNIDFEYEKELFAPDGSFYLPDFTVNWRGLKYYWEHVGRLDLDKYKKHWENKENWYDKFFPGKLITTYETPKLSSESLKIILANFKDAKRSGSEIEIRGLPLIKEILDKIKRLENNQSLKEEKGIPIEEEIILSEENSTTEYKESLRVCLKTKKPEKYIELGIIKTIAAFLNSDGGVLYIGVADNKEISGLDLDFRSFSKEPKDSFRLKFDNLIKDSVGNENIALINGDFYNIEDKVIFKVVVKKSNKPVFITKNGKRIFFIRGMASTHELDIEKAIQYIGNRFK